jgi:hypothetical protein
MVVKIHFGRGPVVARRMGKNSRIALLAAGVSTMVSICFASLGIWRLCEDVGLAGDFVFTDGFVSHWQVWIAAAAATQYAAWRLGRYARLAREQAQARIEAEAPKATAGLAANI